MEHVDKLIRPQNGEKSVKIYVHNEVEFEGGKPIFGNSYAVPGHMLKVVHPEVDVDPFIPLFFFQIDRKLSDFLTNN